MHNPLARTPFLALLIPLIVGTLVQYFLYIEQWSIHFFLIGTIAMLLSYFVPPDKQFSSRWLFGAGANIFIVGIAIVSTNACQQHSEFTFTDNPTTYRAIVSDIPQDKPKSTAYKVKLPDLDKNIMCYMQLDTLSGKKLSPGDEFVFRGKIQPIKNIGNRDDFDYEKYMYNKGFAGSVYLRTNQWEVTYGVSFSLKTKALRCRQYILDFYKSLGFSDTEYAILAALTVGYQDALSDDLKQSFRTTGTVHILSVSGLHVGIIYSMIAFLLSFISRRSKYYWAKPLLVILLLWVYSFITGLPPSVVRASSMLTVVCISEIFNKKKDSLHSLYIAAFFILLVNPFLLFDIGFQLSFVSVLSILILQPRAVKLFTIKNRLVRKTWQLFTLSIVAQLATFPICLYYFGTFPTYFFVANMVIVPLVSLIIYSMFGVVLAKLISCVIPQYSEYLFYLPIKAVQLLVRFMTSIADYFVSLPFAQIKDVKISFLDLCLLILIILSFLIFLLYKKSKALIVALSSILILLVIHVYKLSQY